MPAKSAVARALAAAFLAGDLTVELAIERALRVIEKRGRWLRPLAQQVCDAFAAGPRPRQIVVARFILADAGFQAACQKQALRLRRVVVDKPAMTPVPPASHWDVPALVTPGEVAEWLGIGAGELDWFADRRSLNDKRGPCRLGHYQYRAISKRFGQFRLIESPKPRLKEIQRKILTELLDQVPTHADAHGFARGRSVRTFAQPHAGKAVVLRLDLADFFPSIRFPRVAAVFRMIGYPEAVADLLAGLCTNATPDWA